MTTREPGPSWTGSCTGRWRSTSGARPGACGSTPRWPRQPRRDLPRPGHGDTGCRRQPALAGGRRAGDAAEGAAYVTAPDCSAGLGPRSPRRGARRSTPPGPTADRPRSPTPYPSMSCPPDHLPSDRGSLISTTPTATTSTGRASPTVIASSIDRRSRRWLIANSGRRSVDLRGRPPGAGAGKMRWRRVVGTAGGEEAA